MLVISACVCTAFVYVSLYFVCVAVMPLCPSRREQKLDKTRKIIYTSAMRETFCVLVWTQMCEWAADWEGTAESRRWKALKPRDHQVTCSSRGTGAKIHEPDLWLPRFAPQTVRWNAQRARKRFPVRSIHDRWPMIQLSYRKCGGGGCGGWWWGSSRGEKSGEVVKRWRGGWGAEGKEGSMEINFHLFNHLSTIWHHRDAILLVMDGCVIKHEHVLLVHNTSK